MKRTGMNEDGKEFMKLILSVIVIVLCSGCFRNNSPISVELSSVERNDTLYLEFEFTNTTEDSLFFVFYDRFSVENCSFIHVDYAGTIEEQNRAMVVGARYRIENKYPKIVADETIKLNFPFTESNNSSSSCLPCMFNTLIDDYNIKDRISFGPPELYESLSDIPWLDKELYAFLHEYYEREKPNFEDYINWLPNENTILLGPKSRKTVFVDVTYLKYIKARYCIFLDCEPDYYRYYMKCERCYSPIIEAGYKKYTGRLTSNAITIDTRNMKLP